MDFKAGHPDVAPHELVRYLLREAGQLQRDAVNPTDLLALLKLRHLLLDFDKDLRLDDVHLTKRPRALLSFLDRLVAVHAEPNDRRMRFSVLHEIGHYVLPNHQRQLFVCGKRDLDWSTKNLLEREASDFAADLLFLGDKFTLEANSRRISAATVKALADKYQASYEATARRLVTKNLQPCMLIVFRKVQGPGRLDPDQLPEWQIQYRVASAPFRVDYFEDISGTVPPDVVAELTGSGADVPDGVSREATITRTDGRKFVMEAEFFCNTFSIFCLLTPILR